MLSRCSVPRRAAALLTSEELHLASFQSSSYVVCSELRRVIGGLVRVRVRVGFGFGFGFGFGLGLGLRLGLGLGLGLGS